MDIPDDLFLWARDKSDICNKISGRIAPFKILLKTRDEPTRLRAWISHHSKIVGAENLIIFDHMSTDPAVLAIYAEFAGTFPIIRFTGFHNNVHDLNVFPELYVSLRRSCEYFCFLDSDENLVLYDGNNRFDSGPIILDFFSRHKDVMAFPGTWLQSLQGIENRFNLHTPIWPLSDGLQWGKPIIATAFEVQNIILHNTQVKGAMALTDLKTNLFVLHRHMASPDERISINLLKLKSRGLLNPGDGVPQALELQIDPVTPGYNYIQEIRELTRASTKPNIQGSFEICANGNVVWSEVWQRAEMQRFIAEPNLFSAKLFS